MGIFKGLFKNKKVILCSPIEGDIVPITEVPDPVFSEKMMGDGFAVKPKNGKVYSPVNGVVVTVFPTKHAIGIKSENDLEIIIHFGIDSVQLTGEGFVSHVNEGDKVSVGDLILEVDLENIKDKIKSSITPVVVSNLESKSVKLIKKGSVKAGEEVMEIL